MKMESYSLNKTDRKLAILIDPDKHSENQLLEQLNKINEINPDFILIGGSLVTNSSVSSCVQTNKGPY